MQLQRVQVAISCPSVHVTMLEYCWGSFGCECVTGSKKHEKKKEKYSEGIEIFKAKSRERGNSIALAPQ